MEWVDGLTEEFKERIRNKKAEKIIEKGKIWKRWFAWYPVTIGVNEVRNRKIKIWLEFIERRKNYHFEDLYCSSLWNYQYRKIKEEKN